MSWKISLGIWMTAIVVLSLTLPMSIQPQHWYELPTIPGLEEKARIMFFHVPTAWLTVIAFLMSTIFSFRYLRTKNLDEDAKAHSAAQLGMIFCILATVTGAVWAKFAWGSYWSWDPRQTSIFAILLIYGALFALRSSIESEDKRATLSAVYSLIAFVTVPFFIFIMPRIMKGLHPGSADDANSGPVVDFQMNSNMQLIFFLSMIGFTILYFWMWRVGYKSIIIKDKLEKQLMIPITGQGG
jgi:heme exporter protein C